MPYRNLLHIPLARRVLEWTPPFVITGTMLDLDPWLVKWPVLEH